MPKPGKPGEPAGRKQPTPAESEARIAARAATHSGMPEVTTAQWALLVRAAGDRPVPLEEVIASFMAWFSPILSSAEIEKALTHCLDMEWVEAPRSEDGSREVSTTALGRAVIEAIQRPLFLAGMFSVADRAGALGELGLLPGMTKRPPPTGTEPRAEDKHNDP